MEGIDNMPVEYYDYVMKFEPSENDVAGTYTYKLRVYYGGEDDEDVYFELSDSLVFTVSDYTAETAATTVVEATSPDVAFEYAKDLLAGSTETGEGKFK